MAIQRRGSCWRKPKDRPKDSGWFLMARTPKPKDAAMAVSDADSGIKRDGNRKRQKEKGSEKKAAEGLGRESNWQHG